MPTAITRSTSTTCSGWTGWAASPSPRTTKACRLAGSISPIPRICLTTCVGASSLPEMAVWTRQPFSRQARHDRQQPHICRRPARRIRGQRRSVRYRRGGGGGGGRGTAGADGPRGGLIPAIRAHAEQFSAPPTATFVGGGRASVDQAAFFNAVLVRYPDLLDTFLTPGGLCHPADNFGAVFAVAEHVGASGSDFLLALAIAYEVQCRFSAQVPVMGRGLNHALQLGI